MNALAGTRVIVTRAEQQAADFAQLLRQAGAAVIFLPVIEIVPPADLQPLKDAAKRLDDYDWILFSSVNAVTALVDQLPESRKAKPRGKIAVIGSATREAVKQLGWRVEVMPEKFVAESLVSALAHHIQDRRVLLPSAAVTRNVVPDALRKLGATVDVVEAYRNVVPENAATKARDIFSQRPLPEWITFLSPSAVEHLVNIIGSGTISSLHIASIGSVTSSAIRKAGLSVSVQPEQHTTTALVQAMQVYNY